MTRSKSPLVVVAVLILAVLAGAGYLLAGKGGSGHPRAAASSTAVAGGSAPKPSAPKPSPPAGGASTPSAPNGAWTPADPALADVCRTKLPSQAQDTLALIAKNGPYPYNRDGIVFENRESRLPKKGNGYYHEFTVVTPGSDDRGTRRVVTGGAGEQYWSPDHYATFQEIDPRC
ncbi:ribonuclease [Kitasatospora cathayae]|uniref:Ribonuclease n=1 Tax=Kitasatospora cathayae TaxID=3004092 RepID=A0ABY7Q9U9_9ACTN|nr:ribonuclease [Kitasatospora sp. HUAS 3-15]WBP88974.1 ribonuclease [Kitasatospora sp. HUAS 3-15]